MLFDAEYQMRVEALITISVRRINRAPVWQTNVTFEFESGTPKSYDIHAFVTDPDGDPLTLSIVTAPELPGFSFNPANGLLVYDGTPITFPQGEDIAIATATFAADDGKPEPNASGKG
jgi:hypothetical protein